MKPIRLIDNNSLNAAVNAIRGSLGQNPNKFVQITTEDRIRNLEQNALLHVIIGQMSRQSAEVGDGRYISPTVMKEWVVTMFMPLKVIHLPNGTQSVRRESTTRLSRKRFAELISHTLRHAVDMGMTIEFKGDKAERFYSGDREWYL